MSAGPVPGLDLAALGAWLDRSVPGSGSGPLRAKMLPGGKSNLTYLVSRGDFTAVVRRGPLGHVQATAHDMGREYRVMAALADTDVPVPRVLAHSEDLDVIGAPFYAMEFVPGEAHRDAATLQVLGVDRVRGISTSLVDALATLHAVDPSSVGLDDFGRPDGYLARQVSRWGKQLAGSATRDLPDAAVLQARLVDRVPDSSRAAVVHGDYRLDNALIGTDDRVSAVIDWEMSTLGDPFSDLALMLVYHRLADSPAGMVLGDAPLAEGFLDESQTVERYVTVSGHQVGDLGFHLGLASYKLAVILEGIHHRFLAGQTVGDGFDRVGAAVEPLLAAGLAALEKEN